MRHTSFTTSYGGLAVKRIFVLIAFDISLMAFAGSARAASFDCAKAASIVEKQICDSAVISAFDDAVAAAYAEILKTSDVPSEIQSRHQTWLAERNRCEEQKMPGSVGICVGDAYRKRLREFGSRYMEGVLAPSFDCAKAQTTVEKLICADAVLAVSDKGMAAAYAKALKSFEAPEAIKAQQQEWLRRRARCEKEETPMFVEQCISGLYGERLIEIDNLIKKPWPCPALPLFKHESEKAQCLKNWLIQHPLKPYWPGDVSGDVQFCAGAYQALATASPDVQYIEPVLSTNDPEHPGLERYRQCRYREAEEVTGLGYDYAGLDQQAHGFRLYRVDLDGNPENGAEEYLYEEESSGSMMNGSTQYVRVDLQRCEVADRLQVVPQRPLRTPNQPYGLNAMITYQGRTFIYEQQDFGVLTMYPYDDHIRQFIQNAPCSWEALQHSIPSDQQGKE